MMEDFRDIDIIKRTYQYRYDYIYNLLIYSLGEEGYSKEEINELIDKTFDSKIQKQIAKEIIKKDFLFEQENTCFLTSPLLNLFYKLKYFEKDFIDYKNYDFSNLREALLTKMNNTSSSIEELASVIFAYMSKIDNFDDTFYFVLYCILIQNFKKYAFELDKAINLDIQGKTNLDDLICFDSTKEILNLFNISCEKDLLKMSIKDLVVLFAYDTDLVCAFITMGATDNADIIKIVSKAFALKYLTPSGEYIALSRLGVLGEIPTLEELGQADQVTRERVRQIESKFYKRVNEFIVDCDEFSNIVKQIFRPGEVIVTHEQIIKRLKDKNLANRLIYLLYASGNYVYDHELDIVYDKLKCSNEIVNIIMASKLYIAINEKDLYRYNYQLRKYICKNYRLVKTVYLLRGVTEAQLISDCVLRLFPDGIKLSDEHDFNKLNNYLVANYGFDRNYFSVHSLSALLLRNDNCIICDKGKYIHSSLAKNLSEELLEKILNYINTKIDVIYYVDIFDKFESELINLGIDNRYYLKGVLDKLLPSDLLTKRDYININYSCKTAKEELRDKIEELLSSNNVITMDQLRSLYPGVRDYMFWPIIDQFEVIWLSYNASFVSKHIFDDKIAFKETVEKELENLFSKQDSEVFSTERLYMIMNLKYDKMMKDLKLINSYFSFYSVLKSIFKEKYYFNRPYISNNKDILLTADGIIDYYISNRNSLRISQIQNYLSKNYIRGINSIMLFVFEKSKDYVLIDSDTLIRKNKFVISNDELEAIKHELNYYLGTFSSLDAKSYTNYQSLPTLCVSWNPYLLVGIVKTYLSNDFEVITTSNNFRTSDYLIQKRSV